MKKDDIERKFDRYLELHASVPIPTGERTSKLRGYVEEVYFRLVECAKRGDDGSPWFRLNFELDVYQDIRANELRSQGLPPDSADDEAVLHVVHALDVLKRESLVIFAEVSDPTPPKVSIIAD